MSSQAPDRPDAVVVGAGPNGLAAAITLAAGGRSVHVIEAADVVGGGCRTAELTIPGFHHDVCSAIHPLAMASPFFRDLPLDRYGLEMIQPPVAMAHPFDDGTAAHLNPSITETAASLGPDGEAWTRLYQPFVDDADILVEQLLGPLQLVRHPIAMARFGLTGLRPASHLARSRFEGPRARAMFAGLAAHSIRDLNHLGTGALGLVLGMVGHAVGWPIPRGGSRAITNALAAHLESLGGTIQVGTPVSDLHELPDSDAVLFDLTPRQVLDIAGDEVPSWFATQLRRYRRGWGVFKVDWALDGPVPWTAEACRQAGTVHVGGTLEEIVAGESEVARGGHPERPFVLVGQQSLFDDTRAPDGQHTLWGYCHVPNGSTVDMTARIEAQIERFAPGFRERIIAKNTMNTAEIEAYNPNYIGGDINGGVQDLRQIFLRPTPRLDPYSMPNKRLYFCSSATPPGGGVHGMCGYYGAKSALRRAW